MAITINGSGITSLEILDGTITDADVNDISASKLTGDLPAISGASLTSLTSGNLTGALPVIDGSNLTGVSGGKVLQVVSATHSTQTTNNTGSYSSTGLTANITPSSTSSKIFISYQVPMYQDGNGGSSVSALHAIYKGGSVLQAFGAGWGMTGRSINYAYQSVGVYLDSPSTTSATTYAVYYRPYSTGSGQIIWSCPNTDGGMQPDSTASLVLMEVAS
jgi:hypothetical protein